MTAKQLIKVLQRVDNKYPRREVVIDITTRNKNMDYDWTHRSIGDVYEETICKTDGDGYTVNDNNKVITIAIE